MQRSIIKRGNPLLKEKSKTVADVRLVQSIVEDLLDTLSAVQILYKFKRGSGVSAPQIGQLVRVSVVEFDGIRRVLINPQIIEHSLERTSIREGCLSFFEYRGNVDRYDRVLVRALDENGSVVELEAKNDFAMLLQHEIDHLDGILYVDRLSSPDQELSKISGNPLIP